MSEQPCTRWPLNTTCLKGWDPDPAKWTVEQTTAVEVASELLWRLTAGRFGICGEIVRPCRLACTQYRLERLALYGGWSDGPGGWMTPLLLDGRWTNIGCGCTYGCACRPKCEVELPGPVHSIITVEVDGHTLADTAYRIDSGRFLVRTDGGCFPECQDMNLPDHDPGAFTVTYWRGREVPPGGVRAVSVLANEVWKQCSGQKCRLPERVTSITREGVTMTMFDPGEYLSAGRTGLAEVDVWLAAVNPYAQRSPSAVYSPDLSSVRGRHTPEVGR